MTTYSEHEAQVLKGATKFVACDFRGRATYARSEQRTLGAARKAALQLIATRENSQFSKGRPCMVYAIAGVHQVVAELVFPTQGAGK